MALWPRQVLLIFGFKPPYDGLRSPEFASAKAALASALPAWSIRVFAPDDIIALLEKPVHLSTQLSELVSNVMQCTKCKWVEKNDVARLVCLIEVGGLVLDILDVRLLDFGAQNMDKYRTSLFLVNGNSTSQCVEPDIVGGNAGDIVFLDILREICHRLGSRKAFTLATGPMWSICGSWEKIVRARTPKVCCPHA